MSLSLRVGGVPEYFNMPWQILRERDSLKKSGIELTWQDYPGGTGAMMRDLREEKLDVAIALTEGVVTEIANHDTCRIAQYYVTSPLTWGIHVAASSAFRRIADLRHQPFAISRRGSGSHLMTYLLAQQQQWPTSGLTFVEVDNLAGAREALARGAAVGFLWERFTTQFLVDQGEFSRVGTIDTPWPCFVVAVRIGMINHPAVSTTLDELNRLQSQWKEVSGMRNRVAQTYNLPIPEAETWWKKTQWATNRQVEREVLNRVTRTLHQLKIIHERPDTTELCSEDDQLVK